MRWSSEELDRLRKLYPLHRKDYLMREFPGRTYAQITAMARYLKVKKVGGPWFDGTEIL